MKTVKYYNPKNDNYQTSEVLNVSGDEVTCFSKRYKHTYKESLSALKQFAIADNPDWHGADLKPLVIMNF